VVMEVEDKAGDVEEDDTLVTALDDNEGTAQKMMGLEDATTILVQKEPRQRKHRKIQPDRLIIRRLAQRTKIEEDGHTMHAFFMIMHAWFQSH